METGNRFICHLEAFLDERPEFCMDGICCGIYEKQSVLLTLLLWLFLMIVLALPIVYWIAFYSDQNISGDEEVSEQGSFASTEDSSDENISQRKKIHPNNKRVNNARKGNKNSKGERYKNERQNKQNDESSENFNNDVVKQSPIPIEENGENPLKRKTKSDTTKDDGTASNKYSNDDKKTSSEFTRNVMEEGSNVEDNTESESKPMEKEKFEPHSSRNNDGTTKRENHERELLRSNDEAFNKESLEDSQSPKTDNKDTKEGEKRSNKGTGISWRTIRADQLTRNKELLKYFVFSW